MNKEEYESALKEIERKGINASEKAVNKLFLNLDFKYIDCAITFKRNNQQVGELDGIFKLDDDYLILIEDDSKKEEDTKKRSDFYTKWSSQENIQLILDKYKIRREIKVIRIYVNSSLIRPHTGVTKESLKHTQDDYNQVLYKDDLEYFEDSFSIIGSWARNDLINYLGLDAKKMSVQKDAIRIFMGTKKAFLFSATAEELLKSCYVYRKSESSLGGYQRMLKANRINKIREAIKKKKILAFPNSIILSSRHKLEEGFNTETKPCKINFPTNYLSFKVVDGQHRLMGFAKLDEKAQKDHNLPIVAFEELGKENELETFITINTEQKSIDPNLLLILKADMDWEESDKFYIEKQATIVFKALNEDKNFFLEDRIFLGYNNPKKGKITLTTLVSTVKKNNLIGGKYHLLQQKTSDVDIPRKEVKKIFEAMKKNFPDYCNLNRLSALEGFFLSNRGLRVVFRLIQFLIRNKAKKNIDLTYEEFMKDASEALNKKDIENSMKNYGEGGANKVTEEIMQKIKEKHGSKYSKFEIDLRKV